MIIDNKYNYSYEKFDITYHYSKNYNNVKY